MTDIREIHDILVGLRQYLIAGREWGLEAPSLSTDAREYLDRRPAPSRPVTLPQLREQMTDCSRCKLWSGRKNLVFGEGSASARLVFVGEAPGREEDLEGRPFVGEAGKLLTKIIESGIGLKREDVYICNVVKCRPPNNRDPEPDEIKACFPFLQEQLLLIKPQVICALGRVAVSTLIGRECRISQERGNWFSWMDIPLMPTFHPAYILRNPGEERRLKRFVWEDVQQIMRKLGLRGGN